ncbi:MAG: hypothetical protein PHC28_08105, partial [Flavobacterium sp.]|uniref:hypothetical protein n=1 Tax=Flavobacterium sp. TaxID=239 RepID=UPI00260B8B71
NEIHKSRISKLKEELNKIKSDILIYNERIDIQNRYITKLKTDDAQQREEYISKLKIQFKELKLECESLKNDIITAKTKLQEISDDNVVKLNDRVANLNKLKVRTDIKYKQLNSNISFFNENNICPTCTQEIHDELRSNKIIDLSNKTVTIETTNDTIQKQLDLAIDQINNINEIINSNRTIEKEISILTVKLNEKTNQLKQCHSLINSSKNITNESKILEEIEKYNKLQEEYNELVLIRDELLERYSYYDIITQMLKDTGIKQTIIKKYIPIINTLVNTYLAKMGFYVRFTLDEDFNETIFARGIEELSYGMFSEGEKQRIDIALLFAWREIAKLQNDSATNLLFFDETLDGSGDSKFTESIIELFDNLNNTNIFVISHSADKWADKFRSQIVVGREQGFSKLLK